MLTVQVIGKDVVTWIFLRYSVYAGETWTLTHINRRIEAFEMWIWKKGKDQLA